MPTKNITLPKLMEQFGSEDACHETLEDLRWPEGVRCPRCEDKKRRADRISRIRKRRQFHCDECGYQFSVRVRTILEESRLPLWKWFLATYIMCESKKGVSAKQLQRMLGLSYKTAWYLCHRIRKAMEEENPSWLSGVVEMDETFVGGKVRGKTKGHKDNWANKSIVLAAVERGGKVRMRVSKGRSTKDIKDFIEDTVHDKAEAIYTDAYPGYSHVSDVDTEHHTVKHRQEWVHGKVHTNTIEGVFSLLDRSILGSYHKVSKKHLPAYLHEVEWRYNNRKNPYLFRDTLIELIGCERMEYKELVSENVGASR